MAKVTINDIAKKANVSVATVSRALSTNGTVKHDTRKRILDIAEELGYTAHLTSANNSANKKNIIGILVPEMANPFLSNLIAKLMEVFFEEGYFATICSSDYNEEKTAEFINELIRYNATGLVLISTRIKSKETLELINEYLNVVSIGDFNENVATIAYDDKESAIKIIQYLVDFGHEKIACVGYHDTATQTISRLEGYKECLARNNIAIRDEYMLGIVENTNLNTGYVRTQQLLELPDPPTAIFYVNDYYALYGYKAIQEAGLQIGTDISLAGFDDYPLSNMVSPSLTTVRVPIGDLVDFCKDIMLKLINNEPLSQEVSRVRTEVILRGSVRPCRPANPREA